MTDEPRNSQGQPQEMVQTRRPTGADDEAKFCEYLQLVESGMPMRDAAVDVYGGSQQYRSALARNPGFKARYDAAMEMRAHQLAAEIIQIADTEPDPNKARVRVDSRKWVASKLAPKTYGDRLDLNVVETVSVSSALRDARLGRLIRDQLPILDAEVIEDAAVSIARPPDTLSVAPAAAPQFDPAKPTDEWPDIFR